MFNHKYREYIGKCWANPKIWNMTAKPIFINNFQHSKLVHMTLGLAVGLTMTAATIAMPVQAASSAEDQAAIVVVKVPMIPAGTSGSIDIPVVVESDDSVGAATVEVHYDSDVLSVEKCEGNPNEAFGMGACGDFSAGIVRLNVVDPNGVSGTHTLATITFNIEDELSKATELDIDVSEFVDADINVMEVRTVTNGNNESLPVAGDFDSANIFLPLILR